MVDIGEKLKNCVVGVAGLGGVGSGVGQRLVRGGIGKVVIADCDVVEAANLYRQSYFTDQVGKSKVQACIENLKRIRNDVEITSYKVKVTPENIIKIFEKVKVAAECFDAAEQKQMFVENLLSRDDNIKIVAASGIAGFGKSNDIQTRRLNSRLSVVGDFKSGVDREQVLTAGRVGIAACHQANAVIEILLNQDLEM